MWSSHDRLDMIWHPSSFASFNYVTIDGDTRDVQVLSSKVNQKFSDLFVAVYTSGLELRKNDR